jgi:hypothetical protein
MDKKIIEFIEDYSRAFSAGDMEELAKFWEIPGVVVCDMGVFRFADGDELQRVHARALEWIRQSEGPVPTKPCIERTEAMSDKLIAINVRWTAPDPLGNEQTRSYARYLLKQGTDGDLRIRVAARTAAYPKEV